MDSRGGRLNGTCGLASRGIDSSIKVGLSDAGDADGACEPKCDEEDADDDADDNGGDDVLAFLAGGYTLE